MVIFKKTHEEIEQELKQWIQLNVILQTMDVAEKQIKTTLKSIYKAVENVRTQGRSISPELIESALKSIRELKLPIRKLELETTAAQNLHDAIAGRVAKPPTNSRTVLELRYRYGFTEIEVCQLMKLPYKRVQQLHNQGIALLSTMD